MNQLRHLGQAPATTTTMSDGTAIGVGIAALLIGGGLGWLGYKYPVLSLGGGTGGSYLTVGGGRAGLSLQLNKHRSSKRGKRRRAM